MPAICKPLDQSLIYAYCDTCANQGNPKSPLRREMDVIKCGLGHVLSGFASMTASNGQLPATAGMDMVKLSDYQPEQPSITSVAWKIFINPGDKAKIEEKFAGRVWTTIGTLLAALADGSLVMITGDQAKKLKANGINNGADMVAVAESIKELERQNTECIQQISKYQEVFRAAGM